MPDVVCLGELLIDFVPTVTGTSLIDAPAFKKAPGGAPANVAVGLARLGIGQRLHGQGRRRPFRPLPGEDPGRCRGRRRPLALHRAGAHRARLRLAARRRRARVHVLPPPQRRHAADARTRSTTRCCAPRAALHFGSISLIGEPSRSATLHAIEVARGAGCLISCDPNLRLALWPDRAAARAGPAARDRQAQLVKISDEELRFLTGSDDPSAAREQLWHDGLELMVVTLGSAGCVYFTARRRGRGGRLRRRRGRRHRRGRRLRGRALQGSSPIAASPRDQPRLRELCRFANAVGALTTTERGAIPCPADPRSREAGRAAGRAAGRRLAPVGERSMTGQIIQVESFDLVVFGGTGDLALRKLLPALYLSRPRRPAPARQPHHRRLARHAEPQGLCRRWSRRRCASICRPSEHRPGASRALPRPAPPCPARCHRRARLAGAGGAC